MLCALIRKPFMDIKTLKISHVISNEKHDTMPLVKF